MICDNCLNYIKVPSGWIIRHGRTCAKCIHRAQSRPVQAIISNKPIDTSKKFGIIVHANITNFSGYID